MIDESRPLRLALVGCGGRGIGVSREFQEHLKLARVTALYDVAAAGIERAKQAFPEATASASLEELGRREDVDAAFIATTDDTHVDCALALKPFKKHLLVEKPLAISIADCDRLVNGFAGERETVQMVGLCMRFNNAMQRVHQLVSNGMIGEILCADCIDHVSVGGTYYFHHWMSRRNKVVGLLLQKGCHSLDFISWVIGSKAARVHSFGGLDYYGGDEPAEKVCHECDEFADCSERQERFVQLDYVQKPQRKPDFCAYSREVDVNDNAVVNVLYESGAKLSYTECHFSPDYERKFCFIGTKGQIELSCPHGRAPEIAVSFRLRPGKVMRETVEMDPGGHQGGDPAMLREFVAAINERRKPLTDFAAGREGAVIAISAEESIESGQVVEVTDPDGTPRKVTRRKGRSRDLSRAELLDRTPLYAERAGG